MEEQGQGYLTVNVRTAGGALPVSGALITVRTTDREDGTVLAVMLSDDAGTSEVIALPAPPKENSLSPGNGEVCSFYTVDTDCEGYYHVINENVAVYDGVTAIQQVLLVPIAGGIANPPPYDLTRFTTSPLPNL